MARIVSLACGVLPEFSAEAVVDAGAEACFAAIGLRLDGQDWSAARLAALRRRIADSGLIVLDAEVLWIRPGPFDEALLAVVDVAANLGARNLLTVSADPDAGATAEAFGRICDHAASAGLPVSLEFGPFSAVTALSDALAILADAARPNGHLLVDALHLSRSRGAVADVAAVPADLFRYAQLCDAGPTMPAVGDMAAFREEALEGRLHLGEGVVPLAELLGCWRADLPVSIEMRSRALRDAFPDPAARARELRARCDAWFAANALAVS